MTAHGRRELKRLFGLSCATLRLLERSGYLPAADLDTYEFRDLLLLRMVGALRAAHVPTRTINRTLRHLKPWLSDALPISRVSLEVSDERVAVRQGSSLWEPGSGQYALVLEAEPRESHILPMKKRAAPKKPMDAAHEDYLRGAELEDQDAQAAKAAYQACLEGDCTHMNARINLGRLLHLEGKLREAELIYRETEEPDAVLFFNLGVVLQDQGKNVEALAAYRDALLHDPGMADIHFNLALLQERVGETQAAFRHLLAYRRLVQLQATTSA
jgi:tetratricopeptide (TPR) repeat protein